MTIKKKFNHWDIKLPNPVWDSDLPSKIIRLEKLRSKRLAPESIDVFMELKLLFQTLENWASARIEGNQTRLLDALTPVPKTSSKKATTDQEELANLREAIEFVENYSKDDENKITKSFILEIHKIVTRNLPVGEDEPGDETPGEFRTREVEITHSDHLPPLGVTVTNYIDELVEFANREHLNQNYLLAAAVFHHRFTWIHPFNNGNGRVVRLLTYAMLQLMGYGITRNRLLNPTAIFFANRTLYYDKLAGADTGDVDGILDWADYFLGGLIEEIDKIDRLLDKEYLLQKILIPVIKKAHEARRISDDEYTLLRWSLNQPGFEFVSRDINTALGVEKSSVERSRMIARLRSLEIITTSFDAKQKYVIELWSSVFIVYLVDILKSEGFVKSDDV